MEKTKKVYQNRHNLRVKAPKMKECEKKNTDQNIAPSSNMDNEKEQPLLFTNDSRSIDPDIIDEEFIPVTKCVKQPKMYKVARKKEITLPIESNISDEDSFWVREFVERLTAKQVDHSPADEWVIEQTLCRCCHAEGAFRSLQDTAPSETITYNEMLSTCFNVQLFPVASALGGALGALCSLCAARLRDAHSFTQQVRACEAHFLQLYQKNCIKVKIEVKVELNEDVNDDAEEAMMPEAMMPEDAAPIKNDVKNKPTKKSRGPAKTNDAEEVMIPEDVAPIKNDVKNKPTKKSRVPAKTNVRRNRLKKGTILRKLLTLKKLIPLKESLPELCMQAEESYKCSGCEKVFRNKYYAARHFRTVHLKIPKQTIKKKKRLKKCPLCVETFTSVRQLFSHKREAHNVDDRIKCNACDKMVIDKHLLKKHMDVFHMMGKKIQCSMCEFESFDTLALSKHAVKHKTTKDHHCKYCKKSFLRNSTLKLHEMIHTGDKRKACAECGQAFVQKASLNYHMTKYHPEVRF